MKNIFILILLVLLHGCTVNTKTEFESCVEYYEKIAKQDEFQYYKQASQATGQSIEWVKNFKPHEFDSYINTIFEKLNNDQEFTDQELEIALILAEYEDKHGVTNLPTPVLSWQIASSENIRKNCKIK